MAELTVPRLDFSTLGELPKVYRDAQTQSARRQTLADLGNGSIDTAGAARRLAAAGDLQGATTLANLGNNERDYQFRVKQADRSQANADRSFGLQEKTANTAQIVTVERPDGMKVPVRVDREGNAMPINVPGMQAGQGNPFLTGKAGTEGQQNAQLYATRMMGAEKILRDPEIVQAATSYGQAAIAGIPLAPSSVKNSLHSAAYQKYDQAQRDFVNAVLRRESGAVISDQEFENARKQYFPQPGDTTETIAQKQKNRAEAIKGIAAAGGSGYHPPYVFGQNGELVPYPQQQPQAQGSKGITKQEYDALPSGATFIAPDGSRRFKP